MANDKEPKSDWGVPDKTQKAILGHLTEELDIAKKNNAKVEENFSIIYNMVHCIRNSKPNDWESDISLPEYTSRILTQLGNFVSQYFSSTDYVEPDIDSDDPKDIAESKAAKALLNTILKDPDNYYYHKIVRLLNFVDNMGYGIIKGGYEQEIVQEFSHMAQKSDLAIDPLTGVPIAEDGTPYVDTVMQRPKFEIREEPQFRDKVVKDRPVFDVWPNQNVYMSPEYCYSLNDKEYVIFECERTLSRLQAEKDSMGYFNLDFLKEIDPAGARGTKTYNQDGDNEEQPQPPEKTFTLFERWGKYPAKQNSEGEYVPAINEDGTFDPEAELVECVIHFVQEREADAPIRVIGFRKSRNSYRPMARFLCYVDMVNDNGFGDGEVNRELQIAIDDNFNIMAYRTQLAAKPSFKGKRYAGIPEKVKTGPNHVTMLENIQDLEQWIIQDNPSGANLQHNLLASRMDYAMSTSPNQMGMAADRAETATVASITNQNSNIRLGMRSMNLEFIGFSDFYRMLLTLCNDFMLPETLDELIGKELASAYNPKRKDRFRPVSQALQTEEGKNFKIKTWQGVLGMIAGIQNPKTPMAINYILGQILELMGGQFKHFKKFMLEEDPETMLLYTLATGAKGMPSVPAPPNPQAPPQNQQGQPQRGPEQQMRQAAPQQQIAM